MDDHSSTTTKGRRGEQLALAFLRERGYRIVEHNFRCPAGELDIVARDGPVLVFVEVRSRADHSAGSALEAVGPAKQAQVARVAQAYLSARRPAFEECRFDVVGITGGDIELVTDAFRIGLP